MGLMEKVTAIVLTSITIPAIAGGIWWQSKQDVDLYPVKTQVEAQQKLNEELRASNQLLKERTSLIEQRMDIQQKQDFEAAVERALQERGL